jgi:hypothetical protein
MDMAILAITSAFRATPVNQHEELLNNIYNQIVLPRAVCIRPVLMRLPSIKTTGAGAVAFAYLYGSKRPAAFSSLINVWC